MEETGPVVAQNGFESASDAAKWEFSNGPEFPGATGSFQRSAPAAHTGKFGGELRFDFTGGGTYVQASCPLPTARAVTHVVLWLKKSAPNKITIRCTDSENQTFQKSFTYAFPGWQEVDVDLAGWTAFWGGKGDGVFRGAPTRFGLIVENDGDRTGSLHIDDVRFMAGPQAKEEKSVSTYAAAEFTPDEGWSVTGEGNLGSSSFKDGLLHFDFGQDAGVVGIQTNLDLMGQPTRLILRVRSDAAGPKVRIRLGSHFQSFDKVLGTLNGRGEQTFETRVGGMTDWRHYGGENDGVPRMPLRATGILLDRGGDTKAGDVRLLGIEAETRIPENQRIVMVPTGHLNRGQARFSCQVRNLLGHPAQGTLAWSVRDWSGMELSSGRLKLPIAAGASVTRIVNFKAEKRVFAECVFTYLVDGRSFGPAPADAAAPMSDAGSAKLDPSSPFGMGLYLYRYGNDPASLAMMDRAAAMGQAAGVKWSREEMQWHRIEPERGEFDWSFYDKMLDTATRHGISVYGLIDYWTPWTEAYTPEGIRDYAAYCKALVTHYKDRIKHWEIWNEPNIFFWSGPKEMYPELLKAAYKAIKETDPNALVLGCSTSGIDTGFIKMVQKAGAPFDILTIHPYRGSLNDEGFMRELRDTAELTKQEDGHEKPVWITEMGLPTQLYGGLSERNQATFLARCYLDALSSGVDTNVSWYDFRDDGTDPFYNEDNFGVVHHTDLSPKPAYRALASVCRTLAGQKLAGQIQLGEGVLAFRFTGDGRETVPVWSPARDRLLALDAPGQDVRITDLMGEPAAALRKSGHILIPLQANCPVFLMGRNVQVSQEESPLGIECPASARAGDQIQLSLTETGMPKDAETTLQAPDGWRVSPGTKNTFTVGIPSSAAPGRYELSVLIKAGTEKVRLPVRVQVVSELLRV